MAADFTPLTPEALRILEQEIMHTRELLRTEQQAAARLIDERFSANRIAHDLQAGEYARRLEILNGEAERLRSIQATYLPREVAEARFTELEERAAQAIRVSTEKLEQTIRTFDDKLNVHRGELDRNIDRNRTDIDDLKAFKSHAQGKQFVTTIITSAGIAIGISLLSVAFRSFFSSGVP
jgi:hypothetical protein